MVAILCDRSVAKQYPRFLHHTKNPPSSSELHLPLFWLLIFTRSAMHMCPSPIRVIARHWYPCFPSRRRNTVNLTKKQSLTKSSRCFFEEADQGTIYEHLERHRWHKIHAQRVRQLRARTHFQRLETDVRRSSQHFRAAFITMAFHSRRAANA